MSHLRLLRRVGVLLLVWTLSALPLLGQVPKVQLLYDDGGVLSDRKTVTVTLTDAKGSVPPDTAAVRQADRIHFLYRPAGDWTFADDATATLRQIAIQQDGLRIQPSEASLLQQDDAVIAARAAYPRDQIEWQRPFTFAHPIDTSAALSLPEVYSTGYAALRRPYDRGRRLLKQGQPRRALDTLAVFFGEAPSSYAFVPDAKATLDNAAAAIVDRETKTFDALREEVLASPNAESLARIESFRTQLDTVRTALDAYLNARPNAGASVEERIAALDTSAATLYDNAYETYRQQTVRVFLEAPYSRAKPAFFVDALVQLLLDPSPVRAASGLQLDSLSTALLAEDRYDDVRRTLQKNQWGQDFQDVMRILNDNLRRHDRLFGEQVFESLRLARTSAAQPYYEILSALNAAAAGTASAFQSHWERAQTTTPDLSLLNALQHWRIARRTTPSADPPSGAALVTEARHLRTENRPEAARRRLERARRMAPDYAPLLYEQGRLHQAQGDTAAARTHFDRAHAADTTYIVPEVATLRLLLDQKQSEAALKRADAVLQSAPYWMVYFAKARALGQLERYDEAIDVLRERCEQLNEKSYALYALMAELYARQEAWKGAAWAVNEADAYEPDRPDFVSRLRSVREQVTAAEDVSLEEATSPPGASGP